MAIEESDLLNTQVIKIRFDVYLIEGRVCVCRVLAGRSGIVISLKEVN